MSSLELESIDHLLPRPKMVWFWAICEHNVTTRWKPISKSLYLFNPLNPYIINILKIVITLTLARVAARSSCCSKITNCKSHYLWLFLDNLFPRFTTYHMLRSFSTDHHNFKLFIYSSFFAWDYNLFCHNCFQWQISLNLLSLSLVVLNLHSLSSKHFLYCVLLFKI